LIICIAEDRKGFDTSIQLLLMSLRRYHRELEVHLIYPLASNTFMSWIKTDAKVTLHLNRFATAHEFDVKPEALLYLLNKGYNDILWIDSDVIVTSAITPLIDRLADDTIVITEEALWAPHGDEDGLRARLWGFEVGRTFPVTLNTAVVRVTRAHQALIETWKVLLQSQQYREAHNLDWRLRPTHMVSDQDVLTALLASKRYSGIPVKTLRRGNDIIQYFGPQGYTIRERISNLIAGAPMFIHSQGPKPWTTSWAKTQRRNIKDYFYDVYLDLSPYTLAAQKFHGELTECKSWMQAHFRLALALRALGLWHPPLVGFPLAVMADLFRLAKAIFARRRHAPAAPG
jgi:hypothetical protein